MRDDYLKRSVKARIRRELKRGLKELDEKLQEAIRKYEKREITLEQYLKLRVELELKRIRIVMENLRKLSKAK
ncbi:MAG: hypothetical protein DRN68_03245 [Thaumarchaeota archaeon]|nr:MAG: hypothetical protein DRN68_03245 [Nitrososphaerota archaeon]